MNYVNIIDQFISDCPYVNLERISLWDNSYQFLPDVYMFPMRLDTETLTNAFLGEALEDLVEFYQKNVLWYLCLPTLHDMWSRYHHMIV